MKKYLLALDEGTTSARAILFDRTMRTVSMAQHEIAGIYPKAGWVEQNPMEIYANQYAAMTECIAKSGVSPDEIAAVGITNQRETVIAWDRDSGKPVANAIVWQCRRTADACDALRRAGAGDYIAEATGLRLDPYFSATKIKWLLDNVPLARSLAEAGKLLVGTVDTWLVWKLTEGRVFVTDRTNASRTMLCNIRTGDWDERLLSLFEIPRHILPEIRSSGEVYGELSCMGARIPIAGIAGDQQAALLGQGCFSAGDAKNTYGTGCFLLAHTGNTAVKSENGLLTTVAATERGRPIEYALEGSVFVGGAIIGWLRDGLNLIGEARDSEYFARKVEDAGGAYLVPAFAGLGAPYWDMHARGTLVGLTAGVGRDHIIRAALESIAYQTEDVLSAMRADMKTVIPSLKVDGGASANALLMQMQSNLSGIPIVRAASTEATAMGAAFLAGLAVGFYRDRNELCTLLGVGDTFLPAIGETERAARIGGWRRAVCAARAFTEADADAD